MNYKANNSMNYLNAGNKLLMSRIDNLNTYKKLSHECFMSIKENFENIDELDFEEEITKLNRVSNSLYYLKTYNDLLDSLDSHCREIVDFKAKKFHNVIIQLRQELYAVTRIDELKTKKLFVRDLEIVLYLLINNQILPKEFIDWITFYHKFFINKHDYTLWLEKIIQIISDIKNLKRVKNKAEINAIISSLKYYLDKILKSVKRKDFTQKERSFATLRMTVQNIPPLPRMDLSYISLPAKHFASHSLLIMTYFLLILHTVQGFISPLKNGDHEFSHSDEEFLQSALSKNSVLNSEIVAQIDNFIAKNDWEGAKKFCENKDQTIKEYFTKRLNRHKKDPILNAFYENPPSPKDIKRYSELKTHLYELLTIYPDDISIMQTLIIALRTHAPIIEATGDVKLKEIKDVANRAINQHSENEIALETLLRYYIVYGNLEQMTLLAQKLENIQLKNPESYFALGIYHQKQAYRMTKQGNYNLYYESLKKSYYNFQITNNMIKNKHHKVNVELYVGVISQQLLDLVKAEIDDLEKISTDGFFTQTKTFIWENIYMVGFIFFALIYFPYKIKKFLEKKVNLNKEETKDQKLSSVQVFLNELTGKISNAKWELINFDLSMDIDILIKEFNISSHSLKDYGLKTLSVEKKEIVDILTTELKNIFNEKNVIFTQNKIVITEGHEYRNGINKHLSKQKNILTEIIKSTPQYILHELSKNFYNVKLDFKKLKNNLKDNILNEIISKIDNSIQYSDNIKQHFSASNPDHQTLLKFANELFTLSNKMKKDVLVFSSKTYMDLKLILEDEKLDFISISSENIQILQSKYNLANNHLKELNQEYSHFLNNTKEIESLNSKLTIALNKYKVFSPNKPNIKTGSQTSKGQKKILEKLKKKEEEEERLKHKKEFQQLKLEQKTKKESEEKEKLAAEKRKQELKAERETELKMLSIKHAVKKDSRTICAKNAYDIIDSAFKDHQKGDLSLLSKCHLIAEKEAALLLYQFLICDSLLYNLMKMSHAIGELTFVKEYNLNWISRNVFFQIRNNIMHHSNHLHHNKEKVKDFVTELLLYNQNKLSLLFNAGEGSGFNFSNFKTTILLDNIGKEEDFNEEICLQYLRSLAIHLHQYFEIANVIRLKSQILYDHSEILLTAMRSCVCLIGQSLKDLFVMNPTLAQEINDLIRKIDFLGIEDTTVYHYYRDKIGHSFDKEIPEGHEIYIYEEILPEQLYQIAKLTKNIVPILDEKLLVFKSSLDPLAEEFLPGSQFNL